MTTSKKFFTLLVARALTSAALLACPSTWALDGYSVTTHWEGTDSPNFNGWGIIVRHDIEAGRVAFEQVLYHEKIQARSPVISSDGSHVAFVRADGRIGIVPAAGGDVTIVDAPLTHPHAFLDWPSPSWIYYLKGGRLQPTGSMHLHRVNVETGEDQRLKTFLRSDGKTQGGNWRIHVAHDLARAVLRTDDRVPEPFGRLVAVDLSAPGSVLDLDRATDRFSCSSGIDPQGMFFADGHQDHMGTDIRRWDDLSKVAAMKWSETLAWGPDSRDSGRLHNLNSWSANSSDWICVHIGWGEEGDVRAANQMLINWREKERIVVTNNTDHSQTFDCSGDLWVGAGGPPRDARPPYLQRVDVALNEKRLQLRFSEPLEKHAAENPGNYAIFPSTPIHAAALSGDGRTVTLDTERLISNQDYLVEVAGLSDRAKEPNLLPSPIERSFRLEEFDEDLTVILEPNKKIGKGDDLFIDTGVVDGAGDPIIVDEASWETTEGPAQAVFLDPASPETYVRFPEEGEYVLSLWVKKRDREATGSVRVFVSAEPLIEVLAPRAGDELDAGEQTQIEWSVKDVTDVRIDFSADGGATWNLVELSIDVTSPDWGAYPWTVPPVDTDNAVLRLSEYSQVTETLSEIFSIRAGTPSLALTSIQAGEVLRAQDIKVVSWDAQNVPSVILEVSYDDGEIWEIVDTVGMSNPRFGAYPYEVPNVASDFVRFRIRTTDSKVEAVSPRITFAPRSGQSKHLEVTRVRLWTKTAPDAGAASNTIEVEVEVAQVEPGSYPVTVGLPSGVRTAVIALAGAAGGKPRLVRFDIADSDPPIEGLSVSRRQLDEFLGGRKGKLVWVNSSGQIELLDFTADPPEHRVVVDTPESINPIFSPDGTRIIYARGNANESRPIRAHHLLTGEDKLLAYGDLGYFLFSDQGEFAVTADWSAKSENGADAATHARLLTPGDIAPARGLIDIHDRAMDAGPNRTGSWLGQVYEQMIAYDTTRNREYGTDSFFLMDGSVADHQTCNGSMAPTDKAGLMTLVIPHDWVRIFSYEEASDRFIETSRFELPTGYVEWEFPEWSTHPGYFTAILRTGDLANHLVVAQVENGNVVPATLDLGLEDSGVSYSHLWLAP